MTRQKLESLFFLLVGVLIFAMLACGGLIAAKAIFSEPTFFGKIGAGISTLIVAGVLLFWCVLLYTELDRPIWRRS